MNIIERTGNIWGVSPEYRFRFSIEAPFKRTISFEWKKSSSLMGRFGGGWNWKLGVQSGGSTVIFNFLVFSITIRKQSGR